MRKALIIGGGIAGLSASHMLQRQGWQVRLVERAAELRADGAGILLGVNAMKVLQGMGLQQAVVQQGQPLQALSMVDGRGRLIGQQDAVFMEQQTGYATVAIARQALHDILAAHLNPEQIELDVMVAKLEQLERGVRVTLHNETSDEYDLVVVADGIHSKTRLLIDLPSVIRHAGSTCWRFIAKKPDAMAVDQGYEYWGKGRRFGVIPVANGKVYCYATINAFADDAEYRNITVGRLRELFVEFEGIVPDILNGLDESSVLLQNDLADQRAVRLRKGAIALVGDAAHAITPNMGQGAALALEDVAVLTEVLSKESEVVKALALYESRRLARVRLIRDRSLMAGKIAQWESRIAIKIRNGMFRMMPSKAISKDLVQLLMDY